MRVSYRIDCLFKLNDEIYLFLDSNLFIMIISPIILKESWRAIMIVCYVMLCYLLFILEWVLHISIKGKNRRSINWLIK